MLLRQQHYKESMQQIAQSKKLRSAVLIITVIVLSLCITEVNALRFPPKYDPSEINKTYHFSIIINISSPHTPSIITPFTRPANITLNYSKTPKILQGITPQLRPTRDFEFDMLNQTRQARLDPRTCPQDIAICYQIINHEQNRTTFGKNYTGVSSYILPDIRVKTTICAGDNLECVQRATHCFCPTEKIPSPPKVFTDKGICSAENHLCQSSYAGFKLCKGNISSCRAQYLACGCGPTTSCSSGVNTCISTRDQLIICKASLSDCLRQYDTCFCGPDVLTMQKGCTTQNHQCKRGNETVICSGPFSDCALRFDSCDC